MDLIRVETNRRIELGAIYKSNNAITSFQEESHRQQHECWERLRRGQGFHYPTWSRTESNLLIRPSVHTYISRNRSSSPAQHQRSRSSHCPHPHSPTAPASILTPSLALVAAYCPQSPSRFRLERVWIDAVALAPNRNLAVLASLPEERRRV